MKIHVHLGVHKTATTYIQSQLHDNRLLLKEAGIGYASISAVRRDFTNAFDKLAWFDSVWWPLIRPHLKRRAAALLQKAEGAKIFVLSDENLLGLISANYWFGRLYPQAGRRIRIIEDLFAGHDIRYFLATRSYPDYLVSSWLQLASRAKAPPFDRYQQRFSSLKRGWGELVAEIAKASSPERVTVWTYDWFREDPLRALSLLAPGADLPVNEEELRRDVLPSLTVKGLTVLKALENHLTAGELRELGRMLRSFPFEEPNPRLAITDQHLLETLRARYCADLERIRTLGVDLHA